MGRLMAGLGDHWGDDTAVERLCNAWPGEIGPAGASLPLRLAGGLHALVLTGQDASLSALYPPAETDADTLAQEARRAFHRHEAFFLDWLTHAPQTNEVRRSVALIAGAALLTARHGLPLVLSELGASAGLNLNFDRFALDLPGQSLGAADPLFRLAPDWTGALPPGTGFTVTDRRGVDLNPLDPADPDHALRLLAYLWPDQPERIARSRAAMSAPPAPVDRGDAGDWLARRLKVPCPGQLHLIYHTIAWQYFPERTSETALATLDRAGDAATQDAPIARLSMETDGQSPGAALNLTTWPGGDTEHLGRIDYHGRWVNWALYPAALQWLFNRGLPVHATPRTNGDADAGDTEMGFAAGCSGGACGGGGRPLETRRNHTAVGCQHAL